MLENHCTKADAAKTLNMSSSGFSQMLGKGFIPTVTDPESGREVISVHDLNEVVRLKKKHGRKWGAHVAWDEQTDDPSPHEEPAVEPAKYISGPFEGMVESEPLSGDTVADMAEFAQKMHEAGQFELSSKLFSTVSEYVTWDDFRE